jgi:Reverse transcriptase (RNA-dependent DNA polymerase)/RNase H-like domain found in reverse transcriptase/Integrase zinc binding domain/Chromo (CHRromatin Organisation MOdifier) domain/Retroviral aspartyl protease
LQSRLVHDLEHKLCCQIDAVYSSEDFLDSSDCIGQCCALVPPASQISSWLRHYSDCKSQSSAMTSAVVVLPEHHKGIWCSLTRRMHKVMTACHSDLFVSSADEEQATSRYSVYFDSPAVLCGMIPSVSLPTRILQLTNKGTQPSTNELTFLFDSKVAGLTSTCLWDSGAIKNFISIDFVRRNGLHIGEQSSAAIILADGSEIHSPGVVRTKLKLQTLCHNVTFVVTQLAPGFDIILGDEWSRQHGAIADYGYQTAVEQVPPSLFLRSANVRLYPERPSARAEATPQPHDNGHTYLSAVQAYRFLSGGLRNGCTPAFTVMVKQIKTEVNSEPGDEHLKHLLDEYQDVFEAPVKGEYTKMTPEAIRVEPGSSPPNRPAFRLSIPERHEVEKQVKELLEKGFIEPSSSGYGAPVLFVPKPDGSLRMCIDYRALNKITVKNKYPLPRIDDLMDNLSGAKYFSSMDLTAGYHQIALHPGDRDKTAFNTHIGKYEWTVLPMGLTNAPAVFQSVMNTIFGRHLNKFVCVYLDDILIFSKTREEHYEHLRIVMDLLRKHDLKAKMKKCEFFKTELKFLGHIVSREGMCPDPAKVATIVNWPRPRSVYEVRSFLGLANYFRRYIKGYAATAAPLTDLLKGLDKKDRTGKAMRWRRIPEAEVQRLEEEFSQRWAANPKCQQSFETLKHALVSAPVLVLPDFDKHFELVTDACTSAPAVGAVLMQDGKPVAYYSRKVSGAEENYSATDIEMLAVISALREWRCYLEGRPFTIITDHKPNTYVGENENPSVHTLKRRARWLHESSGYNYTWCYRPGRINVADPISRAPQHFAQLCALTSLRHCVTARRVAAVVLGTHCCDKTHTLDKVGSKGRVLSCLTPGGASGSSQVNPVVNGCTFLTHAALCVNAIVSRADHQCTGAASDCAIARDAEVGGISAGTLSAMTRGSSRTSTSAAGGGIDTPTIGPNTTVQEPRDDDSLDHGDMFVPSRPEDELVVSRYIVNDFVARLLKGYSVAPVVSPRLGNGSGKQFRCDKDGLQWTSDARLVIPKFDNLRHDCLASVHAHPYAGHYGRDRTLKKAAEIYFWPGLAADVAEYCNTCYSCQSNKAVRKKPHGLLHPLPIPGRRWEQVSMDLITDLPRTEKGFDTIVVFVDKLSKMVHLVPTDKTVTGRELAFMFADKVWKLHGLPKSIVSDRDVRFNSQFWRALHDRLGINLAKSTGKHPQTDGQTENANGVLEDTLRHFVGPSQTDWDDLLPSAEFAMNNAWNSSIRNTPFMLNYGQNPDTPTTLFLRDRNPEVNQFVGRWSEQIQRAKACLTAAQQRQKANADRLRQDTPIFKPGDEVLISMKHFRLQQGLKAKLAPRFIGPFKVLTNVGPQNLSYRVQLPPKLSRMHNVFHVSSLRAFHRDGNYKPPPPPDIVDGHMEWEVDWIESTRGEGKKRQYLVHWLGYQDEQTWEPESMLTHCPQKLREFWDRKQIPCPHPLRGEAST